MSDAVVDAICAGVDRSRPHGVPLGTGADCWACETGERPLAWGDLVSFNARGCRGCLTVMGALALHDPDAPIHDRMRTTMLDSLREHTDEFDPIRVTVERELARRASPQEDEQ